MHDAQGGGTRGSAAEELILRTIAAHADSLSRTARRYSLCPDDAQDAYQRALEIFMRHAERLDPDRAAAWLHVVVKREAHAIRSSRQRHVASDDVSFDEHEARSLPTPDERLATFDLIGRSAEALKRLKPQELRALWLRAQGHSYNEICVMTGWSYTKVNRCLTEGRRTFLERYADIESGAECERWMPVISALVDGELAAEQLADLRPHLRNCPGCRATLRALQDSSAPLAAVLPVPFAVVVADTGDHLSNALTRLYEMVAGGLHDRATASLLKVQAAVETATAGKAAAIAGAAAAVASGGYATVERTLVERPVETSAAQTVRKARATPATSPGSPARLTRTARTPQRPTAKSPVARREFEPHNARSHTAPEFSRGAPANARQPTDVQFARSAQSSQTPTSASDPRSTAPEFRTAGVANEFGP